MKTLFIGSVVSQDTADYITLNSRVKPSVAPINFQRNLIKGLSKYVAPKDMSIISLPPVATYPNGCFLSWGNKTGKIFGYLIHFIPTVNLPIIKQISSFFSTLVLCIHWSWKNREEKNKIVLVYGQTAYVALAQILICGLFRIKSCNIVTDPIRYRSDFKNLNLVKQLLIKFQWYLTERIKNEYSSFVLLTESMVKDYISNRKPYIILEGIADPDIFKGIETTPKADPPVIMYSGAISEGFGIPKLLDSFRKVNENVQLWLFGSGTCEEAIKKAQNADKRIKYWGKVPWRELLRHMKEATLLLSVKPVNASHSEYQFPSKIMEYMSSGTPVLATRVKGIPDEYFDYIFPIENDSIEGFVDAITTVSTIDIEELKKRGILAKQFISEQKNCYIQAKRVITLLESVLSDEGEDAYESNKNTRGKRKG